MIESYTMKIEQIFYLKKNQDLTQKEINFKIQNVLTELKKESMRIGHKKGVSICKNALNGLENANNNIY